MRESESAALLDKIGARLLATEWRVRRKRPCSDNLWCGAKVYGRDVVDADQGGHFLIVKTLAFQQARGQRDGVDSKVNLRRSCFEWNILGCQILR